MTSRFFDLPSSEDETAYGSLCTPRSTFHQRVRDFIEVLYARNHAFVGSDIRFNARKQLEPCFWELYLADALRMHRVALVPRAHRGGAAGPDFFTSTPRIWIEAVAPGPGNGPDRVPSFDCDKVAREVPDEQIKLRYLAAIDEKRRKLSGYLASGIVLETDPFVIALNGGSTTMSGDFDPPRIIRTLLGIGWPVLHVDPRTGEATGQSWGQKNNVRKRNGATVAATGFLTGDLALVSAVLFSNATPWNATPDPDWPGTGQPGCDFVVVHNPMAANRLPVGCLPANTEYRIDQNRLVRL